MQIQTILLKLIVSIIVATSISGCSEQFSSTDNSALIFNPDKFESADKVRGGRLYDTWWLEKGKSSPPSGVNPIWQEIALDSSGKPFNNFGNGGGQWRCKECHGWDYKGNKGAYSITSNRYTGFKGVDNNSPSYTREYIHSKIAKSEIELGGKSYSHAFYDEEQKLNEQDIYDLTRFIFEVVLNDSIDVSLGDINNGQIIYEASTSARLSCANIGCHKSSVPQLIDIAQNDAAKFLHNIRFGSPGSLMPSGLIISDAQDVWAFVNAGANNTEIPTSNFDINTYDALTKTDVEKGAQLYDRWWLISNTSPSPGENSTHPLWPASNTVKNGPQTWRCSSCHGWDYRGKAGDYGDGAFATGFTGIVATTNSNVSMETADNVYSYIKETESHGFNNLFSDEEYYALTKFIMTMRNETLTNNAVFNSIDDTSHYANNPNTINGKSLYENNTTQCSVCHGVDGKLIDLIDNNIVSSPNKFLNNSALENPWAFIHAVRFGKPGTSMNGLYLSEDFLLNSIQAAIDILGHTQQVIIPNIERGALLFDKWWNVKAVKTTSPPDFRNKQWIASDGASDTSIISDKETWRCSVCHGWDYDGAEGALNNTQHDFYSGISGLYSLGTLLNDKSTIVSLISNGITGIQDHTFSKYLSIEDISDVADFMLNNSSGIPATKSIYQTAKTNGDVTAGEIIYENSEEGACIACHGINGTSLSRVDIGHLSLTNPEAFIHTVQYGHPGSNMVTQFNNYPGFTLEEASDVLQYSVSIAATNANSSYSTASIARGARLYENWLLEKQQSSIVTQPTTVNPMWNDDRGIIPENKSESWLCSSCHSWDYLGTVTGSGDNLVEAIATQKLLKTEFELQNFVFDWIKTGATNNHNFGINNSDLATLLDNRDIWDLTKFILDGGVVDLRDYINNGSLNIEPDSNNGKGLYLGSINNTINCASCHGYYGDNTLSIEQGSSGMELDIFRTSSAFKFPFRSLHYIRFGKAGTNMAGIENGLNITLNNSLNILDYLQQRYSDR